MTAKVVEKATCEQNRKERGVRIYGTKRLDKHKGEGYTAYHNSKSRQTSHKKI